MIITKLHIENFGKLHDLDMELSDGVNQIYKENGWGKSSLTVFVKAMLYGMPAKARGDAFNYERSRFMPWQGGNYGGFIQIKTADKEYKITRFFGKTPEGDFLEILDLTNNQKFQNVNIEFGEKLFGVGRESFEVTSFFPQLKFASSANSQITANLTGVDKFQNDLSNFNQAIKIIDTKVSVLKKEKPKKDEIENLRQHINENRNLIEIENKKMSNLKNEFVDLETAKVEYQQDCNAQREDLEERQNLFNKKLKVEENLRENTDNLNKFLSLKNSLLEKNHKSQEENKKDDNKQKIKPLKNKGFIVGLIFLALVITVSCLTGFGVLDLVPGVIAIVVLVFIGIIFGVWIIKKIKKYSNNNINNLSLNEEEKTFQTEIEKIDGEIKILERTIKQLGEEYSFYSRYSSPDRIKLESAEMRLQEISIDIINKKNQIENIEKFIDNLIEQNDKMLNDYNLLKEKYNDIDDKIKILTLTKEYMLQARENVSKRFIVPINQSLKKLLSEFGIIDRSYVIDTEWNVKEETNFGTKEFQYSSQGLQDIISFCQRINLIGEVYKKEKPVIILDDTFVNFDDQKLKVAKKIVKEISKTYQIIYICCNEKNLIVE